MMKFARRIKTKDNGLLPNELHLFLRPKDPKSITVGNTFSNQRLSWLACEDKLAFINNVNNNVLLLIDLSDYLSEACVITCGEEMILPGFSSPVLLLGCETSLGGLLLFYQPNLKRMIRIIEIDFGVSSISIVDNGYRSNPLLPDVLSNMDGIIALGGVEGSLILVDLHFAVLQKALNGEVDWSNTNWAWPSAINKLQYISLQADTWDSVQQKIDHCQQTNDSLAFLLNDNEGELLAPKHGHLYSGVTCLHYSPIIASLFVGYEVGVWQMWSIPDIQLMYSSKWDVGQGVSVVGLSLMEPSDDPRHYLYLWVGHSRPPRPAFIHRNPLLTAGSPPNSPRPLYPPLPPSSQEPPFSLIYSLSYKKKSNIDSYGLLYSDFYKCDDIFELEMVKELDNFVYGRILSVNSIVCVNPHRRYYSKRDEEKEMLRVWSIVWECEFDHIDDRTVYVTLFDLNQWYNKMPGRLEMSGPPPNSLPIHDTPYLSTWYLLPCNEDDEALSLWVDPGSLAASRFLNQLDVHYYPSNISYNCIKVGTQKICRGEGMSVLKEIKNALRSEPATAMAWPEPLVQTCISTGLLPNYDDTTSIHSITITSEFGRRYLLTICLENGLRNVILGCARHWFDSACTDTSVSLDFLIDFLWDLLTIYKKKIDELCVCLFDCSGVELNFLDSIKIEQLNEYIKEIKSIYNVLIQDYPTFKKIYVVEHRFQAIELITFYVDLINWFITHNFLPEQSVGYLPLSSLSYNYEQLKCSVALRRTKSKLLIDEMVKCWISQEVEEWGAEVGGASVAYPPPSIQSIIRLSLIAGIKPHVKHFFILYFLQDFLGCMPNKIYSADIDKIIHNYETYFGIREGQMRIIQSFRDIDRKLFKEGVERMLHRSVKNCDLEVWEHRHIVMVLHKQKKFSLAYRYLKGMQPPLGTTDDIKMDISLNVALGNVSSAFFITQQWSQRRPILLKHFFQECVNMNQFKNIYPLPFDKYEEDSFLDFLRSSNMKVASDLILYYYIDRHRYAEAFTLYEQMKVSGQCGGQDSNSRKRDLIMKSLEARFGSKILLLQQSVWEAKNSQPPPGFFQENWKPTSSYLKFDDTNPKRPLLKSSIKELSYITVWQGQKLSKMREKADSMHKKREENVNYTVDSTPLVERVKTLERSELNDIGRKRQRVGVEMGGIKKKPCLIEVLKQIQDSVENELPSTPRKQPLDYAIVQDMVSTPRVEQNRTPRRQTLTPGPTSILRVRSGKKDDVSSCDESSSTPRKTLKFSLPTNADKTRNATLNSSRPLRLEELSDDETSVGSMDEDKDDLILNHLEENVAISVSQRAETETLPKEEKICNKALLPEDENMSELESSDSEEKSPKAGSDLSDEEVLERRMSLEDRLQQIKTQNRKLNSFMNEILTTTTTTTTTAEQNTPIRDELPTSCFTTDVECTFISGPSSEVDENSRQKGLESNDDIRGSSTRGSKWHIEGGSAQTISQGQYDMVENNSSSSSDSMDKVYTSMEAPVQKLSTVFEAECENDEPCCAITDSHVNTDGIPIEQNKENYTVTERGNYQESDLGDEKLDQECDYIQFAHEDNYAKDFDSESENVIDDVEVNSNKGNITMKEKNNYSLAEQHKSDSDDDVVCLDSDSDDGSRPRSTSNAGKGRVFTESDKYDSSSRSSFSEEENFDEEFEEDSYEEGDLDAEEIEEEEKVEGDSLTQDSDIEELSDNGHRTESMPSDGDCDSEASIGSEQSSASLAECIPLQAVEPTTGVVTQAASTIEISLPNDPSYIEKAPNTSEDISVRECGPKKLYDSIQPVKIRHDTEESSPEVAPSTLLDTKEDSELSSATPDTSFAPSNVEIVEVGEDSESDLTLSTSGNIVQIEEGPVVLEFLDKKEDVAKFASDIATEANTETAQEKLQDRTSFLPVDPFLLEKIVSFSKTVSVEQLNNLVNVVKTSVDSSHSALLESSKPYVLKDITQIPHLESGSQDPVKASVSKDACIPDSTLTVKSGLEVESLSDKEHTEVGEHNQNKEILWVKPVCDLPERIESSDPSKQIDSVQIASSNTESKKDQISSSDTESKKDQIASSDTESKKDQIASSNTGSKQDKTEFISSVNLADVQAAPETSLLKPNKTISSEESLYISQSSASEKYEVFSRAEEKNLSNLSQSIEYYDQVSCENVDDALTSPCKILVAGHESHGSISTFEEGTQPFEKGSNRKDDDVNVDSSFDHITTVVAGNKTFNKVEPVEIVPKDIPDNDKVKADSFPKCNNSISMDIDNSKSSSHADNVSILNISDSNSNKLSSFNTAVCEDNLSCNETDNKSITSYGSELNTAMFLDDESFINPCDTPYSKGKNHGANINYQDIDTRYLDTNVSIAFEVNKSLREKSANMKVSDKCVNTNQTLYIEKIKLPNDDQVKRTIICEPKKTDEANLKWSQTAIIDNVENKEIDEQVVEISSTEESKVSDKDCETPVQELEVYNNFEELGTNEVGREVKVASKKPNTMVEMVDKCIMTDKKRHSKRKSKVCDIAMIEFDESLEMEKDKVIEKKEKAGYSTAAVPVKSISKMVDRSMITDKRGIDTTIVEFNNSSKSPRRSRRRSSSLQPDDKNSHDDNRQLSKAISSSMDSINKLSYNYDLHKKPLGYENDAFLPKSDSLDKEGQLGDDNIFSSQTCNDQNKESLHDPSKPARNIRTGLRRSMKTTQSVSVENDSHPSDKPNIVNELETIKHLKLDTENIALSADTNHSEEVILDVDKPNRNIRKVLRRKSSITTQDNVPLEIIPEDKVLLVSSDIHYTNNSKSLGNSRSLSEPNITLHCKHPFLTEHSKSDSVNNVEVSKYLSHEELNLTSLNEKTTPRRSTRLSKPLDPGASPSSSTASEYYFHEPSDKKMKLARRKRLDFVEEEEEPDHFSTNNSVNTRRAVRKSKTIRMSTLEDIVEVPEFDSDKSMITNPPDQLQEDVHTFRRRHTMGIWEPDSKTDLSLLAMQKAKSTTRRRTQSSSSEPPMTSIERDINSDIPAHWLRSSARSENSESAFDSPTSQPITSKYHKTTGADVLKLVSHRRRSHNLLKSKNNDIHDKSHSVDTATAEESESEAPPFSPLTVESSPSSSQSQLYSENHHMKKMRGNKKQSVTSSEMEEIPVERLKPTKGRRRTLSSSSEPPITNTYSPLTNDDPHPMTSGGHKKRKSFVDLTQHLSGADVLNVGRRSRSLHEGNKIPAFKHTKKLQANDNDDPNENTKHLPSTSAANSPQLYTLLEEYSANRRLTRHQRSLIERSLENTPTTPETVTTPKRRRRSSVVGSEDDLTPVRSSKRLQDKANRIN